MATRSKVLERMRKAINRIACECVDSDDVEPATSLLAASMLISEAKAKLEELGVEDEETQVDDI